MRLSPAAVACGFVLLACALLGAPSAHAVAGPATAILVADDFEAETSWEWRAQTPAPAPQSSRSPTSSGSGSALRVAVVLVGFADEVSQPFEAAEIEATLFSSSESVAGLFAEQSGGLVGLSGTVFGQVSLSLSATTCDYLAWAEAAEAAVGGDVLAAYTNLIVVFPKTDACSWAGLAYLGGSTAWINGEPTLTAFAHELGHNLGLGHASSLICTANDERVTLSETCTIGGDYGDPFTTMGSGTSAHLTAVHKAQLGWLAPGTVQTVTTAGTFTLAPLAAPGHGLRALRIPWGDEHLYVEFRQPYGLFERFWPGSALGGVMIRLADESAPEWRSRLLDATPATPAYLDATLVLGQVLIDPVVGVRIATISVTREAATVAIEFGTPGALPVEAPADRERPTAPRVRGASVSITAGRARVRLRWHRSRDASGIRQYVVLRNGRPIARTNRPVLIDRPRLGRRHFYRVVAIDRAGNRSARSRRLAVPLPRHLGRPRQATGRGVVRAHVGTNGRVVVNGRAAVRAGWTVRYVLR